MKFAVISPTHALDAFSILGDIHLVLAHVALKDKAYREFYEKRREYKILDNGLFENGEGLSNEELLEAARMVKADELVLRDVLFDRRATFESSVEMYNYFLSKGLDKKYAFMGVPQADNIEDWIKSYCDFANYPFIRTIGLSKLSIPKSWKMPISQARMTCIDYLFREGVFAKGKHHHLLGGSNTVLSEIGVYNKSGYSKWLDSIDTSAPYVYGESHLYLHESPGEIARKIDFDGLFSSGNAMCIVENIRGLEEVCHNDN